VSSARDAGFPECSPQDWVWQAPLVPPAVSATIGLLVDRYVGVPILISGTLLAVTAVCWLAAWLSRRSFSHVFLWIAVGLLACLYHHVYRNSFFSWDIGEFAADEPKLVRIRGTIVEEPVTYHAKKTGDPLVAFLRPDSTYGMLEVSSILGQDGWLIATGRTRLIVQGSVDRLHHGDTVEIVGWLQKPSPPANPGQWDRRKHLLDQRLRSEVYVRKSPDAIVTLTEEPQWAVWDWFAQARRWGSGVFGRRLPAEQAALASALLLGETSAMDQEGWERFVRTGVIHVLAISGQHLVILAFFLWLTFRVTGIGRRRGAWIVAVVLIAYALLTGFRPSTARATVTVVVACFALMMRRQTMPANTFALAWLAVIAIGPTDIFSMGCQLAFVQVAVMTWGLSRWFKSEPDAIERLIDASRSRLERGVRTVGKAVLYAYALNLVLGLVSLPLVASRQHIISPIGWVIGPPVILLTSISLLSGFLLLFTDPFGSLLSAPFAFVNRWSLAGCDALVELGERVPFGHLYVPNIPEWWLWCFYFGLLAVLWCKPLWKNLRWSGLACVGWAVVGLSVASWPKGSDELRVTFLAVGHGGCTVLETPDGRVLVYDAGAIRGPEVTRHSIAPFLWSRGHRRIDELFLSHADLDHFNGTTALLERFEVHQVTCTPSFADKRLPGVQRTLSEIERRGIPVRIVQAGDLLHAGEVTLEVLHPPAVGPEGNENTRSMVLFVKHLEHSFLLTGDIEGAGQERLLRLPGHRVDVLMAPHHGSKTANTPALARWAKPQLVVACQGPPRGAEKRELPYDGQGAIYWGTWPHGAVMIHSSKKGLSAATFQTKLHIDLKPPL